MNTQEKANIVHVKPITEICVYLRHIFDEGKEIAKSKDTRCFFADALVFKKG